MSKDPLYNYARLYATSYSFCYIASAFLGLYATNLGTHLSAFTLFSVGIGTLYAIYFKNRAREIIDVSGVISVVLYGLTTRYMLQEKGSYSDDFNSFFKCFLGIHRFHSYKYHLSLHRIRSQLKIAPKFSPYDSSARVLYL